ncbi:MAG TPA: TadE/TadG family type IV pilus assembly protein [Candidatus Limnocylindrales bacterium]|nr:TadE/TadG family type IV pilus assembly protein [Candidatus Limnocylindrales bacterium]
MLHRFRGGSRERRTGQSLVLFAICLTALVAVAGLVVDIGGSWSQARGQQKVADVASLAAATSETNGGTRAEIIQAAYNSAAANGFLASEVTVNIPPVNGAYAPGGSASGPLSTNDCSTPAKYPCWVEVIVNRAHSNSFSRVVGLDSFDVTARGVSVGGVANAVKNGIAPLMFNYKSVTAHGPTNTVYCDPHPSKCSPNSSWPMDETLPQFSWTTFCETGGNCNVNSADAMDIINGGNYQFEVTLNMFLGPHNNGDRPSVCHDLLDQYPNGGDLPVAINDDNGNLVGFWIWHLDSANSNCQGGDGEQLSGWFVSDATSTLPLSISSGGGVAQFGKNIVSLVE